jgi:hypothetical protein
MFEPPSGASPCDSLVSVPTSSIVSGLDWEFSIKRYHIYLGTVGLRPSHKLRSPIHQRFLSQTSYANPSIDIPQCPSPSFRSPSNTLERCVRAKGQGGSDGEDGRWLRRNKRSNRGRVKARRTAPPTAMSESGQGHPLRCRSIQLSLTEFS